MQLKEHKAKSKPSPDCAWYGDGEVWDNKVAADIMETAIKVFAEQGFGMAGMRAIAKKGRYSLAKAYYYFPNKEALLQAIIERASYRLTVKLKTLMRKPLQPEKRLEKLISTLLEYHARHFDEFKVLFKDTDLLTGERTKRIISFRNELNEYIVSIIGDYYEGREQDLSDDSEARVDSISAERAGFYLLALVSWSLMNRYRLSKKISVAQLSEEICLLYLRGVHVILP